MAIPDRVRKELLFQVGANPADSLEVSDPTRYTVNMVAFRRPLLPVALSLTLFFSAQAATPFLPRKQLDQLHHTAWTTKEGAPPDIWAMAQSDNGLLWLGTGAGLYSFDGIRFTKFHPAAGEALPASDVNALHVSRNGDVWIGFNTGAITRLRAGHLTNFDLGLPRVPVLEMAESHDNILWVALGDRQLGGLAFFDGERWAVMDRRRGLPEGSASSVLVARDGSVWTAAGGRLSVLRPGTDRFIGVAASAADAPRLKQDPDGHIWLTTGDRPGLQRLPLTPPFEHLRGTRWFKPPPASATRAESILFERDGTLWGTYGSGGVFRIPDAGHLGASPISNLPADTFGLKDGLSSDLANPILEDREGNIWVGTNFGLDQFRKTSAVMPLGIPRTSRLGFMLERGEAGSMYIATTDTLFQAFPDKPAIRLATISERPRLLFFDNAHGLRVGFDNGIAHVAGHRLMFDPLPKGVTRVAGWTREETPTHVDELCFRALKFGHFCWRQGRWDKVPSPMSDEHVRIASMIRDLQGHMWQLFDGSLALQQGRTRRVFSQTDGLAVGNIEITFAARDAFYVAGDFGIARFDGRRFTTLLSDQHQTLTRISGIAQDTMGNVWINAQAGVIRVSSEAFSKAFTQPSAPLPTRLFDYDDGIPGAAQQDSHVPTALTATDGRIWFITGQGIALIDPRHLAHNELPPPVLLGTLTAGNHSYRPEKDGVIHLPKGTANLQISYTAPSLSVPKRVRFRYRLDEVDADWVDPGARREAFYTALGPGEYHFSVVAANDDGVWNPNPAHLTFTIAPTFRQSVWFKALVAILCTASLWLLYALRVRQIASRLRALHQERLSERERIARELHDTLLQAFQGLLYRFQALADQLPAGKHRDSMEHALDLADDALLEGRERVADLRKTSASDDLTQALAQALEEMMVGYAGHFRIVTEGQPREIPPIISEEIIRIGQEAVANALRHARSDSIEINVVYEADGLTIAFRDQGTGIDSVILASGGRNGHFGMIGMHERAHRIRAVLTISSEVGLGTDVTLTVPPFIAYSKVQSKRWWQRG